MSKKSTVSVSAKQSKQEKTFKGQVTDLPVIQTPNGLPSLPPSAIYWDSSINASRLAPDGTTDDESWGDPSKDLLPSLAGGWNASYGIVPVIMLDSLPQEEQDIIRGTCNAERTATLASLKKSQSPLASLYEYMYFIAGTVAPIIAMAFGAFRRASVLPQAASEWAKTTGKGMDDYLVPVEINPPMSADEIFKRVLLDNQREGTKDSSDLVFLRNAKRLWSIQTSLQGEDFRRAIGLPPAKRSIFQKIECLIHLDRRNPELRLIDRMILDFPKDKEGKRDYTYSTDSKIPFKGLPNQQPLQTLLGNAKEDKTTKVKTHIDQTTADMLGLGIDIPATAEQIDYWLTQKFNTEKPELLAMSNVAANIRDFKDCFPAEVYSLLIAIVNRDKAKWSNVFNTWTKNTATLTFAPKS